MKKMLFKMRPSSLFPPGLGCLSHCSTRPSNAASVDWKLLLSFYGDRLLYQAAGNDEREPCLF